MKLSVPYATVEAFLRELGIEEPGYVREVRMRAPRSIEVLLYARNEDGTEHVGAEGVALEGVTIHVETLSDDPEFRDGLRRAEQIADLLAGSDEPPQDRIRLVSDDEDRETRAKVAEDGIRKERERRGWEE